MTRETAWQAGITPEPPTWDEVPGASVVAEKIRSLKMVS